MKESKTIYVKRTQKDYSLSFKMGVVQEIERGELTAREAKVKYGVQGDSTIVKWLRKYGTFDSEHQIPLHMPKRQEQKLMELAAYKIAREAESTIGEAS